MKNYSAKSIAFLKKAPKQKKPEWLDKNWEEYQDVLVEPTQHLVQYLQKNLGQKAKGYKFPKRFAIIKRNKIKAQEQGWFKNWIAVGAEIPTGSLFESNPGLYFYLSDEEVFCGAGLYMITSGQTKKIREWIGKDASKLEKLFADKKFKKSFKGFSDSKKLKTFPRGFDQNHPHIEWLRLSAYYVGRSYTKKQLFSKNFAELVCKDFEQALRFNEILFYYLNTWAGSHLLTKKKSAAVDTDFDFEQETEY